MARLMREAGLKARAVKIYHANPGTHDFFESIPNRVHGLPVRAADEVWVGDIPTIERDLALPGGGD